MNVSERGSARGAVLGTWPPGHWWRQVCSQSVSEVGWQLPLGQEEAYAQVRQLTLELDQLLQSDECGNAGRRCELGIALAQAVALAAAYSEQLRSVGGLSRHDYKEIHQEGT